MKILFYRVWQCTWGVLQTFLGLCVFLMNHKEKHYNYHGAIITEWKDKSSVSLGMFVFVTKEPYFADKYKNKYTAEELSGRLLVHEYGHTIQSMILGPLYLIIIGIPSTLWGFLPKLNKMRREKHISYFAFFTESWANVCGEKVTKDKSMENLIID